MNIQECYKILGVNEYSSMEEIRHAYYNKAKQCHPDIKKTGSEEEFKKVKNAYEYLKAHHTQRQKGTNSKYNSNGYSSASHKSPTKRELALKKINRLFTSEKTRSYFIQKVNAAILEEDLIQIMYEMDGLRNNMDNLIQKIKAELKITSIELISRVESCVNLAQIDAIEKILDLHISISNMLTYLHSQPHIPYIEKARLETIIQKCQTDEEVQSFKSKIDSLEASNSRNNSFIAYQNCIEMTSLSPERKKLYYERLKYCNTSDECNNILMQLRKEDEDLQKAVSNQAAFAEYKQATIESIMNNENFTPEQRTKICRLVSIKQSREDIETLLSRVGHIQGKMKK